LIKHEQLPISQLIDIYYDLFEYFNDNEPIVNAISTISKRDKRFINKAVIRKDITSLNLLKYSNPLQELYNLPKLELEKYKKDFDLELLFLNIIDIEVNKDNIKLIDRIIKHLTKKIKEMKND
jgi:hypothetical protein